MEIMSLGTYDGLVNLKNWLAPDHLAVIDVDASKYSALTGTDVWSLDNYVNFTLLNHANTVVYYDDNLQYTEG